MRIAAALSLFTLIFACAGSDDPATAEYWIDKLDKRKERIDALKELAKIGDPKSKDAVLEWFQQEGDWQPDAAYTLGQLNDPAVVPDLIAGINFGLGTGQDRKTRRGNRINQNIAKALAHLKAKEAVTPLTQLLESPELTTQEQALRALGTIGDKSATPQLVKLANEADNPFIRKTAIQALGDVGDPAATDTLIKMLYVELPGTSFYNEARFSLLQVGKPAIPALMNTVKRNNKDVEAIRMADGNPIAEGAIEAKAAFVLGALRATEAESLLVSSLSSYYKKYKKGGPMFASVPGAVMELAYALGNLGAAPSVKVLGPITMDKEPSIRMAATEALTTIGDPSAVPVLLKSAGSGDIGARRAAIVAVSRLGGGEHIAAYDKLAKGGGKDAPADVLKKIVDEERSRLLAAKECSKDVACWTKKLTDQDELVRERAAYQLGWMDSKASIANLVKACEDDSAQVRMAAVLSLSRLDGVKAAELEKIHEKWKNKIDYQNVNLEIRRLVARLGSPN